MELEFASLCHSSSSKQVVIDNNSANSVSLDLEPSAPTSRLVVASSVVIQDKSGRVCARYVFHTCIQVMNPQMQIMACC